MEDDRLADPRGEEDLRAGDQRSASAAPASPTRRRLDIDIDRGDGGARAADRGGHQEGLDPCAEGACARISRRCSSRATTGCRPRSSARATAKILVLATNGKRLHAGGLEAARRARLRRSRAADGRYRRGRRHRARSGPGGRARRCCVAGTDARGFVQPGEEVWPTPARAGRCSMSTPRTRRLLAVPPRATMSRSSARTASCWSSRSSQLPGDGPRQGRSPAALQGRRGVRRQGLQAGRGPDLARHVRPHLDGVAGRTQGLDRQQRRSGTPAAQGLPENNRFGG